MGRNEPIKDALLVVGGVVGEYEPEDEVRAADQAVVVVDLGPLLDEFAVEEDARALARGEEQRVAVCVVLGGGVVGLDLQSGQDDVVVAGRRIDGLGAEPHLPRREEVVQLLRQQLVLVQVDHVGQLLLLLLGLGRRGHGSAGVESGGALERQLLALLQLVLPAHVHTRDELLVLLHLLLQRQVLGLLLVGHGGCAGAASSTARSTAPGRERVTQRLDLLLELADDATVLVLVHHRAILDLLGAVRVAKRRQRLVVVVVGGGNRGNHDRLWAESKGQRRQSRDSDRGEMRPSQRTRAKPKTSNGGYGDYRRLHDGLCVVIPLIGAPSRYRRATP